MPQTLHDFLFALDRHTERVPLDELCERMQDLRIDLDEIRQYMLFGPKTYQRNLLHAGPGYQALILCWRSGQRSPIHDHTGSSCGVRILTGVATETLFERTDSGYVYATGSRRLQTGQVCGSQDADIHQVSNLQPDGHDLVTLHVYSPALLHMGTYSLTDRTVRDFFDPIHTLAFAHGDGI
jgi:cysteine dioxygenase